MDYLSVNGYIKVVNGGKVLYDGKNTVTELLAEITAAGSIQTMYACASPVEAGQSFIVGKAEYINSYGYPSYAENDYLLTVYFLNLPDVEKKALNSSSHLLPIYNSKFEVDQDKLVAYATMKYSASAGKEGYLTDVSGINIVNPHKHSKRFKWDAGVAVGEYNCIAVGVNVMTDRFNGIKINRSVDFNNTLLGEAVAEGYFLRPGVKTQDGSIVYTTDQEILLGSGDSIKNARRVLNMVTGETSLLETSDHRYNFPLVRAYNTQMVYKDYFLYNSGGSLKRMDLKTKSEDSLISGVYDGFIYNGFAYGTYSSTEIRAYNIDTFSREYSQDLNPSTMNLPFELNKNLGNENGLKITNCGDGFLITCGYQNYTEIEGYDKEAIICSDITDVGNSIVDIVPQTPEANAYIINGKKYFFTASASSTNTTRGTYYYKQLNSTNTKSIEKTGTKFTTEGLYGNLLSFKTFDAPQVIDGTKELELEYTYSLERTSE